MAKDITLKSPNGEVIYYPKTVSELVYDNETGRTLKQDIEHLSRNKIFSEVTGEREKNLQNVFLDCALNVPTELSDCYYAFGVMGTYVAKYYAVDNNHSNRPEWNNYIKEIGYFNFNKGIEKNGIVKVYDDRGSLLVVDKKMYDELVTDTKYNLWGWKVDKKNYVNNVVLSNTITLDEHQTTLDEHQTTLDEHQTTLHEHQTTLEDISELGADETKAVHQLFTDDINSGMMWLPYNRSTFCGWRRSIGKVNDVFDSVQIPIYCHSYNGSTKPITEITVTFREIVNNEWGDVIYSQKYFINPVNVGETFTKILRFSKALDLSSYNEVGLEYIANSYSSFYNNNRMTSTDGLSEVGQYLVLNGNNWRAVSGGSYLNQFYYKLYNRLKAVVKINDSDLEKIKNDVIEEVGNVSNYVDISLPNKIYAVVGDTLQIFFRGCIKAVNPYNYDILVKCSKGKKFPRYFEYLPTTSDVGTTTFAITVKDNNGNVLGTKQCELVTVSNTPNDTTNKHILCFGDSLTSGGNWCKTADDKLPSNILFKGSKTNGTTKFFGVGGWTWESYTTQGRAAVRFYVSDISSLSLNAVYTNNGVNYSIIEINVTNGTGNILCTTSNSSVKPTGTTLTKSSGNGDATVTFTSWIDDTQNPLWSDGNMTFVPYVTKYCDGNVDFVYTLLSWNGQTPHRTDFTSVINQVTKFARTLHAEYPNAKLRILGVQIPSINGGMGANYGATGTSYADGYGMVVTALNQNNAYQEFCNSDEFKDYCEFINVSTQFDTDYNMPYTMKKVNTRSELTEMIGANGVHPADIGYMQIGDVVYRSIMKDLA